MSLKNVWARAERPVLYVTLGALLLLGIKNCSDGDVARETNEGVKKVLGDTDLLKRDTDTIKAFSKATHTVVQRTETKVDDLQETADSILSMVDSCCDCDKQREQKPVPKKRKPVAKPRDTIVVKKTVHDTVYVDKPSQPQDTTRQIMVTCKFKGYVYH